MKLEDFKKVKNKLFQEYRINKKSLKQLESREDILTSNRRDAKFINRLFFQLIFCFSMMVILVFIFAGGLPLLPIEILSSLCVFSSTLVSELINSFWEKDNHLTNKNKSYLQIVEESIKCEIEEQKLLYRNEILKSMVEEFNTQENVLKDISDKYYLFEKKERKPINELMNSIKNKEKLLAQKNVLLDKLIEKNELSEIFRANNNIKNKDILFYFIFTLGVELWFNVPLMVLYETFNVGLFNFSIPCGISLLTFCLDYMERKNEIRAVKKINASLIKEIEQNDELDFSDELEQVFDEVMNLRMELEEDKINLDFRQKAESFLSKDKDNNFSYSYNPNNSLEVIDVSLYKEKNNYHLTKKRVKEDSVKNT